MSIEFYKEAQDRIPSQTEKIIRMLKEAGSEGVTNAELANVGLRYGARMAELYKKGYVVQKQQLKKGLCKYVLIRVSGENKFITNATEEILEDIELFFNGSISAIELKSLLNLKDFHITRKPNWFKNRMH